MISLCIDTSGVAAITLVKDGQQLAAASSTNPRRHAESLPVLAQAVVEQAAGKLGAQAASTLAGLGIEQVLVGTGPGPYTGLRAGLIFASTIGRGLGVPVLGICSLDALAVQEFDRQGDAGDSAAEVLILTDARRKEVYWGRFRRSARGDVEVLAGPGVGTLSEVVEENQGESLTVVGPDLAEVTLDPSVFVRLVDARPGENFPLDPLYLRRPDVHVKEQVSIARTPA